VGLDQALAIVALLAALASLILVLTVRR